MAFRTRSADAEVASLGDLEVTMNGVLNTVSKISRIPFARTVRFMAV